MAPKTVAASTEAPMRMGRARILPDYLVRSQVVVRPLIPRNPVTSSFGGSRQMGQSLRNSA
jgi:hypothetical protein